jgi:DNA-binding NtrC family response regulator
VKRNLLFVNRYPDIIKEFLEAMQDKDVEIDTVQNGLDAVAYLRKKEYQIVVLGLTLDGYNGEQLIAYVNKTFPKTVCIVYTTNISAAQLHFIMNQQDVFRVFLRPVNFRQEFFQAIEEAFECYAVKEREEEEADEWTLRLWLRQNEINEMQGKLEKRVTMQQEMAKYMKRLLAETVDTYSKTLSTEAKKQLKGVERDIVDLCLNDMNTLVYAGDMERARQAVEKIREISKAQKSK